jgi:hypothetical protein
MKWNLFTKLKCIWVLLSNSTVRQVGMTLFMEGTYERVQQFEFTKEKDIITIVQVDKISELYQVKKTVIKEYLFNTTPATQTHEKEEWYAVYDAATRQLQELNHGRACSFYPTKCLLLLGSNEYQKIA